MNLYDTSRPRSGGTPALLARKSFVVPRLSLWPLETSEKIRVSVMIPATSDDFTAREVSNTLEASELPELLSDFRADPEGVLASFFEVDLTKLEKSKQSSFATTSSDDLEEVEIEL